MSKRSSQAAIKEEHSGWGYVGLCAIAPIVCCAGPLIVGALGVVGATWLGGVGLGLIALAVLVGWRTRKKRRNDCGTHACLTHSVHDATTTPLFQAPKTQRTGW
jgi:hypothetical protein